MRTAALLVCWALCVWITSRSAQFSDEAGDWEHIRGSCYDKGSAKTKSGRDLFCDHKYSIPSLCTETDPDACVAAATVCPHCQLVAPNQWCEGPTYVGWYRCSTITGPCSGGGRCLGNPSQGIPAVTCKRVVVPSGALSCTCECNNPDGSDACGDVDIAVLTEPGCADS